MSGEGYSTAQKIAGETSYELIDALRQDASGLTDSAQAEIVSDLYALSNAIALRNVVSKEMNETNTELYSVYREQGADGLIEYLKMKYLASTDGNNSINQDEAQAYLDSTDLTNLQKAYYWRMINSSWKNNPYK